MSYLNKREYQRHYRKINPEKARAHRIVANLIKQGELVRPVNCPSCGSQGRIEAHHQDYKLPEEVIFLCQPCHQAGHQENIK